MNEATCFQSNALELSTVTLSSDQKTLKQGQKSLKWKATGPLTLRFYAASKFTIANRWLSRGGVKVSPVCTLSCFCHFHQICTTLRFLISREEQEVDKLTTVLCSPSPQYSPFFVPPALKNFFYLRGGGGGSGGGETEFENRLIF